MKIKPEIIQALSLFVPKKDLRYYLMNIHFELQLDKTLLVATTGAVLLCVCIDDPNEKEDSFLIPPVSFPKSKVDYEVSRGDDGKLYVTNDLAKIEVPKIEGRYPDFRRAIPTKSADEITLKNYDPELLVLFKKASKLLGGWEWPIVYSNDIVDIGLPNVVGVIASIRSPETCVMPIAPYWLANS